MTEEPNIEYTLTDNGKPFAVVGEDKEGHYWKPLGWTTQQQLPTGPYRDNGIQAQDINRKEYRLAAVISAHNCYTQHRKQIESL